MKPQSALRHFLTLAGSNLLVISSLQAASVYWSADGTTQGGATGNWDTTNNRWGAAPAGPFSSAWNNVGNDTAIFGGTAGTATLTENITVGALRFDTTGYAIDSDASTLSFGAADNAILFNRIAAATINNAIGGSGNVVVSSANPVTAGTLTLGLTSTGGWSGSTTVNAGMTVLLNGANRGLSSTSAITLNGGGISSTNTNSTQAAFDRIANGANITSNGGTITFTNTVGTDLIYAETLGSVALTSGQLNVVMPTNQNGTNNTQTLTLSGLTRTGATNSSVVTFSAGGTSPNATTNLIAVTGATATPADQIIGPWATAGTAAGTQNRWAVYDGSGNIIPDTIADTANDSTWTTAANAYSLNTGAAVTIDTTRTVAALRFIGATSTLTLGLGNLETSGLFLAGTNVKTVASTGGVLTTPSGGGNLFITTGNGTPAHVISAPINNNGGTVTVVKSGGASLTLSSTTSNFSGGIVLNAGTLVTTADTNLGSGGGITFNGNAIWNNGTVTYARNITLNNGAIMSFNGNNPTISGNVTGSGGITLLGGFGNQVVFSGSANTFEGPIFIGSTGTTGQAYRMQFSSFADSATAKGDIVFTASSVTHGDGSVFQWNGTAGSPSLTLSNRQIRIVSTGSTPSNGHQIRNNNASAGNLTINTDLAVSAPYAQTVALRGTSTGTSTFAGKISDNPNAAAGTTVLAATYAIGATTATLASVQGVTVGASISGTGIDAGTTITAINPTTRVVTLSTPTIAAGTLNQVMTVTGVTNPVSITKPTDTGTWTLSGNNSYSGGTTLSAGRLNIDSATAIGTGTLLFSSAASTIGNTSGSAVTLSTNNAMTWNQDFTFATGSDPLNLGTGAVTMGGNRGITTGGTTTLTVGGVIGATGAFGITKGGGGTLVLTNTGSTYTGATNISQGVLQIASIADYSANSSIGAPASGDITIGGSTTNGTLAYAGGTASTNRTIRVGQNTAGSTGNATINNNGSGALTFTAAAFNTASSATANRTLTLGGSYTGSSNEIQGVIGNNTSGLVNLVKADAGTWTLSGANTYTGNTTVNDGTLVLADNAQLKFVLGATSGTNNSISGAGTVTLNGDFVIDTTAADALPSGTWTLENVTALTGAYGSTFTVVGFTDAGGDKWTKANGATTYTFDETTGVLTLAAAGGSGYAAWQAANSTGGGLGDDHDNDGVDNGTEWFLGGNNSTTGFTPLPAVQKALDGTLSVTWVRHPDYPNFPGNYGTDFVVETSTTLTGPWTAETPAGTNVIITGDNVKYTFPGGPGYTGKNFARLKVTGP